MKTGTLNIIDMYDLDNEVVGSSGANLYRIIVKMLNANAISINTVVGFAADGARNIMEQEFHYQSAEGHCSQN